MRYQLSTEEKNWNAEAIHKCLKNGKVSLSEINKGRLCDEFKKKFGRPIAPQSLYNRLYRYMNPSRKTKKKQASQSNYLVFVKLTGQCAGFETEEEVKTFIEQNQVIGNNSLRIFKYVPVNVQYKVIFGE